MQFTSSANDSTWVNLMFSWCERSADDSLWDSWSQFSDQLSLLINDQQAITDISQLISRISNLDRYTTIWNGKPIDSADLRQ